MSTEGQCILISLRERCRKLKICYLSSYFPFLWFKCSKPLTPYKIDFGKGANGKYLQSDIRWLPPHMYRSGTVNSKSFVGKVLLRIKWKFELTYAL